jgi:hypothetical protein
MVAALIRRILLGGVLLLGLSGCLLVPIVDGVKKIGVTKSDRMALLPDRVQSFNHAMYWGRSEDALAFALPESRPELMKSMKEAAKYQERIVETKVDFIDFDEDGTSATVDVTVKAFRVPVYVVNDTARRQRWVFSLTDGWQLAGIDGEIKDAA